ncbi:FixH family protein [Paenibacillus sediminis]|nr:FixH family protein [Paenibacillus sediminis]
MLIFIVILIAGCSNSAGADDLSLEPIQAVVTISPQQLKTGQLVTFQAKVTQGSKVVDDADKVEFEIWEVQNVNNRVKVPAKHTKDGIYTLDKSFSKAGTYRVYAHVYAHDQHTMPLTEFTINP